MKITKAHIHNFRSIIDSEIFLHPYAVFVGANNAGKSTVFNAIRAVYDDYKWTKDDFPKVGATDEEAWVELTFDLTQEEWDGLADKYKEGKTERSLSIRRYFKSSEKERVKANQSNIFGYVNNELDPELFYGAKNIGSAKIGSVIYIPALTTASEQTKMSGPSPLRNILSFLLKKVVSSSAAYQEVTTAFEKFNNEAREKSGFLNAISEPLNQAIAAWSIQIDLSINSISPEDVTKSLVKFAFVDAALGDGGMELEKYGHGFQRSVIYELIRLAPTFREEKTVAKKEFAPDYTLILFEEPEAFLHPSQQESMAFHLRKLGAQEGQQVFVTSHSPTFAGKAAGELKQLVRMRRADGTSKAYQVAGEAENQMLIKGGSLLDALVRFVEDVNVPDDEKANARRIIAAPPEEEIALQEEKYRFHTWLDGERSSMFFADRVLLVEGATERALFNYLLADKWHDLSSHRIFIVDVLGKYNFHRYMALLEAYGIHHGIMLDDDNNKNEHQAINELVRNSSNAFTLSVPIEFQGCLETFLGVPIPGRDDKKPIEIMKCVDRNSFPAGRLDLLRAEFIRALAL